MRWKGKQYIGENLSEVVAAFADIPQLADKIKKRKQSKQRRQHQEGRKKYFLRKVAEQ